MYNYTEIDPAQTEYSVICPFEELQNGERLFVEIDQEFIVVFNIAGEIFAIEDLCSHDDGPLGDGELEDHEVVCPRHGAHFDVRTGEALSLPAVEDIKAYPVRIRHGQVEVGIPKGV